MKKFVILSIDGGGVRGIIPSIFLGILKDMMENHGQKKPFHKVFNLMAGTSTGGLISLALSAPLYKTPNGDLFAPEGGVVPQKLPQLYETLADRVFPGNRQHVWRTMRQFYTSKYAAASFHTVLFELFGTCTVKNALTNLLLTSFDMKTMQPIFMKKRTTEAGGETDPDFFMMDAALATTAVPTYFPPAHVIPVDDNANYSLVDGGIFCINPAMSALTEARKISPESEFILLSLGTGTQTEEYNTEAMNRWGFFNWIAPWLGVPLINAVGEGQRISTNHMLKRYPGVTLYRFDVQLDRGKGRIDDASPENLNYLRKKAQEMIQDNQPNMQEVLQALLTNG
ncbi:MAG: patatin-like phospholipase family protein [Thermoclostridium sp.]|nr:patatin-like phospholipase family protein [Thermoclostridium sp.]